MKIFVTGAAGFIGFHLIKKLLKLGNTVVGIDNLNSYYDVHLKKQRLSFLDKNKNFLFIEKDLLDLHDIKEKLLLTKELKDFLIGIKKIKIYKRPKLEIVGNGIIGTYFLQNNSALVKHGDLLGVNLNL